MPQHVDTRVLQRLVKISGSELALELLDRFLNESRSRLEGAQAALASGDLKQIEHHLHRLSSDAAWLGLGQFQQLASQGELLALEGSVDPIPALLTDMLGLLPLVCAELELERSGLMLP